ncbi:hypothetical protein BBK36DRAFT_21698 [Trichoderma citrinoviride]|uniref:Uncharacterized protein n=1 Tax=Trichoderma citrinoviride TaxID=58853 RepID=A0A2T4B6K3_9HYPO|nr:hypothetical protein BBK36DRAFT_21698 [Trichoderma citrinoviride]PTB64967.1 hypothetical protein BBK36DRAFT_21698 [Trichoderma citrinoviride]
MCRTNSIAATAICTSAESHGSQSISQPPYSPTLTVNTSHPTGIDNGVMLSSLYDAEMHITQFDKASQMVYSSRSLSSGQWFGSALPPTSHLASLCIAVSAFEGLLCPELCPDDKCLSTKPISFYIL